MSKGGCPTYMLVNTTLKSLGIERLCAQIQESNLLQEDLSFALESSSPWLLYVLRNLFGFRFEWRVNGWEWCGWLDNTNNQASSSPWVCPTTIKFCSEASFRVFSCRCGKRAIFYGWIEQDVNFQHQQKTIDSCFRSVLYGEDIIMGLWFFLKLHIMWCCEHIF